MSDTYVPLRERLKLIAPDLAADLDHQWKIATTEWLPVLGMSMDSSNGLVHIRNIENHLDIMLHTLFKHNKNAAIFRMRPIEIYLLLAAILFHDIGRIVNPDSHGDAVLYYFDDRYGNLGFHNREVARSLGRICPYHDKDTDVERREYERKYLSDIVIDPYGEVRQRMIAALLTLGDRMDNAHTRAIPPYLKDANIGIKGQFRNIILGVFADPAARMIKTVLLPRSGSNKDASENIRMRILQIGERYERLQRNSDYKQYDTVDKLCAALNVTKDYAWYILISIVLQDLHKNRKALYSIRDNLSAVGLPLATWLVDCDERLYTPDWHETYEPLFTKDYLNNVAKAMWELSRRIIGMTEFLYAELAAYMGDHDVPRVRIAVRRISILACGITRNQTTWLSPIWVGDKTWKWHAAACNEKKACEFYTLKDFDDHFNGNRFSEPYSQEELAEVSYV